MQIHVQRESLFRRIYCNTHTAMEVSLHRSCVSRAQLCLRRSQTHNTIWCTCLKSFVLHRASWIWLEMAWLYQFWPTRLNMNRNDLTVLVLTHTASHQVNHSTPEGNRERATDSWFFPNVVWSAVLHLTRLNYLYFYNYKVLLVAVVTVVDIRWTLFVFQSTERNCTFEILFVSWWRLPLHVARLSAVPQVLTSDPDRKSVV